MNDQQTPKQDLVKANSQNWLQRLKDESWEAELLVSAISIYGTFQLFKVADWTTNKFIDFLPQEQYIIGYYIVVSAFMAISVLVSMFVIHFFLRAYWVGLVGLNSVFPDYGLKDSAYSEIYTKKILAILPRQEETIQKVDELCSVIFSVAFCFLLIYAYISITASLYLFLYNKLSPIVPEEVLLVPVAIIGVVLILNTLLNIVANIKRFKQNEPLQTFYFTIAKITSLITFGPLYKYLLQITMTFGSNYKKKKALVGLIIMFFFSGVCVAVVMALDSNIRHLFVEEPFRQDVAYASYYNTENSENDFLLNPELESDVIHSKVIKLFIPLFSHESANESETCGEFMPDKNISEEANKKLRRTFYMDCWQSYHQLTLNGVKIKVDFMRHFHSRTDQYGLLGYIDEKGMKQGKNILEISKVSGEKSTAKWAIPFHYYPKE